MIAILFSFLLFQFSLAQWPDCPPSPGSPAMCQLGIGDCNMVVEVTSSSPSYFDDWDIPLSSVTQGPAVISIDSSITIPNRWTIMPADFCFGVGTYVDGVNAEIGVDIDTPWNVWNNGSTYNVPEGQYGILVINPWTAIISGTAENNINSNCVCEGSFWAGPFIKNNWQAYIRQADTSEGPGTFIGGTVSLLLSSTTPIPCRLGPCSHS
jgi:hypothetical protein